MSMTTFEHHVSRAIRANRFILALLATFVLMFALPSAPTLAQSQPVETLTTHEPAPTPQVADSGTSAMTYSPSGVATSDNDTTASLTSGVAATSIGLAFVLWGLLCVLLLLAGLPGTWLLIATAVAIDCIDWVWLDPASPLTFHPLTIMLCAILAGIGELLEFLLSAAGAKRFGASARGMWGSVIGGMLGAVVGSLMLPIIGTILGAALGTATGAIIGELSTAKRTFGETVKPAIGAVIGRILGTLAKLPIALTVWVVLAFAVFA